MLLTPITHKLTKPQPLTVISLWFSVSSDWLLHYWKQCSRFWDLHRKFQARERPECKVFWNSNDTFLSQTNPTEHLQLLTQLTIPEILHNVMLLKVWLGTNGSHFLPPLLGIHLYPGCSPFVRTGQPYRSVCKENLKEHLHDHPLHSGDHFLDVVE